MADAATAGLVALLNAFGLVLVLVLVAAGLAVVYGLMGVFNLAHGEFYVLGAYTLAVTTGAGLHPLWGLLAAPAAVALVAAGVERSLIRRLYGRPLDTLLATWGLSILLRQGVEVVFGQGYRPVPHTLPGAVELLGASYPIYRLAIMAVSVAIAAATYLLLYRTTFGLRLRGAVQNPDLASSLGIDTVRVGQVAFVYGAALAGLAGALMAPLVGVYPGMGLDVVLQAFLVVIVGGLGSLAGLAAGAVTIGGAESALSLLSSAVVARVFVLVFAIGMMHLRPRGLVA